MQVLLFVTSSAFFVNYEIIRVKKQDLMLKKKQQKNKKHNNPVAKKKTLKNILSESTAKILVHTSPICLLVLCIEIGLSGCQ